MTRLTPLRFAAFALFTLSALSGCQTSGVGDPCVPQAIPEGGFTEKDIVIETTSVMCRTRVCIVYGFTGDPTHVISGPDENTCEPDGGGVENDPLCRDREVVREHVFCSCRCDSTDPNVPTCACPGGFACTELQQGGGASVEGSYCVRDSLLDSAP